MSINFWHFATPITSLTMRRANYRRNLTWDIAAALVIYAGLELLIHSAPMASTSEEALNASLATLGLEGAPPGIEIEDLQDACRCMVKQAEGNDVLLAELVDVSKLPREKRMVSSTPAIEEIEGICFGPVLQAMEEG